MRDAVATSRRPRAEPSEESLECAVGRPTGISLGLEFSQRHRLAFVIRRSSDFVRSTAMSVWVFLTLNSKMLMLLRPLSSRSFYVWFDMPVSTGKCAPCDIPKGRFPERSASIRHRQLLKGLLHLSIRCLTSFGVMSCISYLLRLLPWRPRSGVSL